MAQKVQIILEDDLSGGPAVETIRFGVDGTEYQIDLNAENAAQFRKDLDRYIEVSTKVTRAARKQGQRASAARSGNTAKIREWAKAQGFEVSSRGRIHQSIVEKYEAAH